MLASLSARERLNFCNVVKMIPPDGRSSIRTNCSVVAGQDGQPGKGLLVGADPAQLWGMVRTASAMMYASRASVLASLWDSHRFTGPYQRSLVPTAGGDPPRS